MPFTNYPNGFANGLSVRGMPLTQMQPGQVFFVGNSSVLNPQQRAGSDGNRGTFLDPFATLNYAVNTMCVQGRGDIVFVLPGHSETVIDATPYFQMNGVAVIGLGSGNSRPTINFTTVTTATWNMAGSNMSFQNILFVGNFLSIASCLTGISATSATSTITGTTLATVGAVAGGFYPGATIMGTGVTAGTYIVQQLTGAANGIGTYQVSVSQTVTSTTITAGSKDLCIDNCEFRDTSTVLGFLSVWTTPAIALATDGFTFTNNKIYSLSTVSPTVAITAGAGADRWSIRDNYSTSPVTASTQGPALMAAGAFNFTNFELGRNRFYRPNTSTSLPVGISASGTAWSGHAYDNYFWNLGASTGIWINTGTKLAFTNNRSQITGAADHSDIVNPAES